MRITTSWAMRWDDVIRDVIFPDEELASLMMIPENTDIITWVNKYFVDADMCTELVTDEDVRVLWYEEDSVSAANALVNRRRMAFDIYVRRDHLNDATNDLLQRRTKLISQKLQEILTDKGIVGHIGFQYVDDYSLGTKMVGYVRHHLVVQYLAGHK